MSYNLADLHMHSVCSDGLLTPVQVVGEAYGAGVRVLSLTDHDSVAGVDEVMAAAEERGVGVVPGTELSAHVVDREVHLLAYFLDHRDPVLSDYVGLLRTRRHERGVTIVDRLNNLGIEITVEDVMVHATGGLVGRPHIAAAMISRGAVSSKEEAFDRFIGDRGPAVVPKPRSPATDVIALVHSLGGVAVLAHPGAATQEQVVAGLVDSGLDGIEVFHPSHQPPQIEYYTQLTERYGLLPSGGSDCHGEDSGARIGDCGIGCEAVDALKERASRYA